MSRLLIFGFWGAVLTASLWLSGCGTSVTDESQQSTSDSSAQHGDRDGHAHADHGDEGHSHDGHEHGGADAAKIEGSLAQLSVEDRALAEAQKICPVSEDPLGAMGKPIKLSVEGHDLFICCKGCEEDLRAEPDTFLTKLKQESHDGQH